MPSPRDFILGPWRAVLVLGVTQILTWGILFYPPVLMMPLIARDRGWSVTAARIGAPHATRLREWCETKAGLTLGIGLGMAPSTDPAYHGFLRVGHMGHVNAHMTLGALAVMEAGLVALEIPHGPGALANAARVVAKGAL